MTRRSPGSSAIPCRTLSRSTGSVTEDLQGHETGSETTSGTIAFTDRKRTRLNSSHQIITDAVFSFKKIGSLTSVNTTDTTGSGTAGRLTCTFPPHDTAELQH